MLYVHLILISVYVFDSFLCVGPAVTRSIPTRRIWLLHVFTVVSRCYPRVLLFSFSSFVDLFYVAVCVFGVRVDVHERQLW